MQRKLRPIMSLQVSDLVIDPDFYGEALAVAMRHERLPAKALEHLGNLLPVAASQLEAIGDFYGAVAMSHLETRLEQPVVI